MAPKSKRMPTEMRCNFDHHPSGSAHVVAGFGGKSGDCTDTPDKVRLLA